MSSFPTYVCEICGTPKRKQGDWYLVAQGPEGDSLRILFWNEAVAPHPRVWTFCCSDHVQEFVTRWLARETASSDATTSACQVPLELTFEQQVQLRDALASRLQVSRAALNAGFANQRESALMVVEAVEAVLESYGPDLELEPEEAIFDA